jgi:hypothetical protein
VANPLDRRMIFHAAVVIVLGLLAGFPYAFVVLGNMAGSERAWRMAHLEGVLNGLVTLVVAAILPRLTLTRGQQAVLAWSFIAMAYGNVVASILAASTNVRGLTLGGSLANTIVYLLFMMAVAGVFVGVGLVAYGARRTGQRTA